MDLAALLQRFGQLTAVDELLVPATPAQRIDPQQTKSAVVARGVKSYYDQLSQQSGQPINETVLYRCWHHDDQHASLCVSVVHGGYECKACGQTNDLIGGWMFIRNVGFGEALKQISEWIGGELVLPQPVFQAPKEPERRLDISIDSRYSQIPDDIEQKYALCGEALRRNVRALEKLKEHYGVSREACDIYKLGWSHNEQRLTIPVIHNGRVVNIRKHDILRSNCGWVDPVSKAVYADCGAGMNPTWDVSECRKVGKRGSKVTGITGHNQNNLYPSENLSDFASKALREPGTPNQWICLTGGELKAICLNMNNIPAVTFTGGEGAFVRGWLEKFRGLNVDICLDADNAGKAGAKKIAEQLFGIAAQVRIVNLPFGDVNDYYRSRHWNFSDWWDLPRESHALAAYEVSPVDIKFNEIHNLSTVDRPVNVHAVVAGGTDSAKFVISGAKVSCVYGETHTIPNCKSCPLPSRGYVSEVKVSPADIVSLSKNAPNRQEKYIRETCLLIPDRCPHPDFEFTRSRVMPVLLAPDSDVKGINWTDQRHFIFPTYYLGTDIPRDNEPVLATGRICADPVTSSATMIVDRFKPSKRSIYTACMSEATAKWLTELDPTEPGTKAGAIARFQTILKDVEFGITRIYDQRTMLSAYLLLFFMPIRFRMFGDLNGKVSPEILVVGDSRQGKTTAADKLMDYFGAGAKVEAEGATYVGLVGGTGDYGTAGKVFSWGCLPMNNGGLVFLDEIDELVKSGIFSKLTSIRSSGVAQRTTANGNRRTAAALRMIMASNPIGGRRLSQYDSLLYAVRELIDKPADLARFELIVGVYKIGEPDFDFTVEKVAYTQTIAQEHLRWAWQQEPSLSEEVSAYAVKRASGLCEKYQNLPVLEPTEARWKVGRIACAIAAIAYSHDEQGNVLVTKDHVDIATEYIDASYATPQWKIGFAIGHGNIKSDDVKKAIERLGGSKFARMLIHRGSIKLTELRTAFLITPQPVGSHATFDDVVATLTMYNDCLKERNGSYVKSDGFRRWLDDTFPQESSNA
jgi:hypothetical protein